MRLSKSRCLPVFFVLTLASACWPAMGADDAAVRQEPSDTERCVALNTPVDLRIRVCAAAIQSGERQGAGLAELYVNLGNGRFLAGELDRALEAYDAAVSADPTYSRGYGGRAVVAKARNQFDLAVAHASEALRLNPDNTRAREVRQDSLIAKGDFQASIADADEWIARGPPHAGIFRTRGYARFVLRQFEAAIADYDESIRLDSSQAYTFFGRANVLANTPGNDRTIADYGEAIRLAPNESSKAFFLYHRALQYRKTGILDRAIEDFGEAIAADEAGKAKNAGYVTCCFNKRNALFVERGKTWRQKGDPERALADFDEAYRRVPNDDDVLFHRGGLRYARGQHLDAIADYDEAIRLNPKSSGTFSNRANAREAAGDIAGALADYGEAIRLDPENARTYWLRGRTWHDNRQYARAIEDFSKALVLNRDGDTYLRRANSLKENDESERAAADYDAAIALMPNNAAAYGHRGDLWYKTGQFDRAISVYDAALRLAPDSAFYYVSRGVVRLRKNDAALAISDFSNAIERNPNDAITYYNRAFGLNIIGDKAGAIVDLSEAIRLKPDYRAAIAARGNNYLALDERDKAEKDFERVASLRPESDEWSQWAIDAAASGLMAVRSKSQAEAPVLESERMIAATPLRDAADGPPVPIIPWMPKDNVSQAYWINSGRTLVLSNDGSVVFHNAADGAPLGALPYKAKEVGGISGKPWIVALREVGQYRFQFEIFDYERMAIVDSFESSELQHEDTSTVFPTYLLPDADGTRIFAETNGGTIAVVDRASRRYRKMWTNDYVYGQEKSLEGIQYDRSVLSADGAKYIAAFTRSTPEEPYSSHRFVGFRIWDTSSQSSEIVPIECPADLKECEVKTLWVSADNRRAYAVIEFEDSAYRSDLDLVALDLSAHRLLWRHRIQDRAESDGDNATYNMPFSLSDRATELVVVSSTKLGFKTFDGVTGEDIAVDFPPAVAEALRRAKGMNAPSANGRTVVSINDGENHNRAAIIDVQQGFRSAHIVDLGGTRAVVKNIWAIAGSSKVAVRTQDAVMEFDTDTGQVRKRRALPKELLWSETTPVQNGKRFVSGDVEDGALTITAYETFADQAAWSTTVDFETPISSTDVLVSQPDLGRILMFARTTNPLAADDESELVVFALDVENGAVIEKKRLAKSEFSTYNKLVRVPSRRELWSFADKRIFVLDDTTLSPKPTTTIEDVGFYATGLVSDNGAKALVGEKYVDVRKRREIKNQDMSAKGPSLDIGNDHFIASGSYGALAEIDLANGLVVRQFDPPAQDVVQLAQSRQKLVVAAVDGTLHLYSLTTGNRLAAVYINGNGDTFLTTPEGFVTAPEGPAGDLNFRYAGRLIDSRTIAGRELIRPDIVQAKLSGDPDGRVRDAVAALEPRLALPDADAPSVRIVSPSDGETVIAATASVVIEVADAGAGVGRVELTVNGGARGAGVAARGFASAGPETFQRTVPLQYGRNVIEVSVSDRDEKTFSKPERVEIHSSAAEARGDDRRPKLHIFKLALGRFADKALDHPGAAEGVERLARRLQRSNGALFAETREHSFDREMTDDAVAEFFAAEATDVSVNDVVVVLIAGRGTTRDGDPVLLSKDARPDGAGSWTGGVPLFRVQDALSVLAARKIAVISDLASPPDVMQVASRTTLDKFVLEKLIYAAGRSWIGIESRDDGSGPVSLLDAVAGSLDDGNVDRDSTISVLELASHVEAVARTQTDAHGAAVVLRKKILGSDFPIAVAPQGSPMAQSQIAVAPTHAVIAAGACVREAEPADAACQAIASGAMVRVLEIIGDDAVIARNGQRLGYIDIDAVIPIQR